MAKLHPRHATFVAEYLRDKNGARAARAAGYTAKAARQTASELLTNPNIRKAVDAGLARQQARIEVSGDRVIQRISQIAFNKKQVADSNILKACELLGKHFKLFTDVSEISGKDGQPMVLLTMPANGSEATPPPETKPDGA